MTKNKILGAIVVDTERCKGCNCVGGVLLSGSGDHRTPELLGSGRRHRHGHVDPLSVLAGDRAGDDDVCARRAQ